jgi:hypothetical protein
MSGESSPLVELIGFLEQVEPDSPQWAAWWEERNALITAATEELAALVKERDAWRDAAYQAGAALEALLLPIAPVSRRLAMARREGADFAALPVVQADAPRRKREEAYWQAERQKGMRDLREAFGEESEHG